MRSAVRDMAGLRSRLSSPAQLKFSLDCSEVFLYEGRLRDAHSELEFAFLNAPSRAGTLLWSIALVRQAQIALARHDLAAAEEAGANATKVASPHADIRVYAAEVLGRSSLRTGRPWSSDGLEECQSAFHALSVRTILARHHLRRERLAAAFETAEESYTQAMRLRYWNLASRSAATLATCLASQPEGQAWLGRALRLYLAPRRQNAFVGDDLFDDGSRSLRMVEAFVRCDEAVSLIGEEYLRRFPDSVFEGGCDSLLARVTKFILSGVLDVRRAPGCELFTSAAKRLSRQGVRFDAIERDVRRLGSFISAVSILRPFEQRGELLAANRRQAYRALYALRGALARRGWRALCA